MENAIGQPAPVAECHGVKVPDSPFVTPARIERINAARSKGQEIAGALAVVQPGDKVLELGAGIGLVGAIVAKNRNPAKVLSFEANPALIEHITALYRLNALGPRIEVRNEVLISAPGAPPTMPFHIRNSDLGPSSTEADTRASRRVDVPTADYAQIQSDFKPDVLLMDIEGDELEFLRHAKLDGIRAIVIGFHPEAYGREGMIECKTILERAGFAKVADHCTRHVWTCTFDDSLRPPIPTEGWSSGIETLDNAIVVPPNIQNFVQPAGVLTAQGGYQATAALWRNGRSLTIKPDMPDGPLPQRAGTWLWGGVLWMHFGHFLVESAARLWALDDLETQIDGVLFIPKRPRNGDEVIGYQQEFLKLMGSDVPLVCAAVPEQVERLIVPGQGFGLGPMVPATDAFRAAFASRFARDVTPDGPEKLYVSRSKLPSGRGNLIGETELEEHLKNEGYTVYHPQKHDIRHQIATYKAARKIIAAEGSALHMVAFVADPLADVAIVVRRPSGATRNLEIHLQSFTGKAPTTITQLNRSWKPRGPSKPRSWMGELNMPALQKTLFDTGFIGKGTRNWPALDIRDVQKHLGDRFEEVA